jgi:hypothetical protein
VGVKLGFSQGAEETVCGKERGIKGCQKGTDNEELHNLNSSPDIIRMIES